MDRIEVKQMGRWTESSLPYHPMFCRKALDHPGKKRQKTGTAMTNAEARQLEARLIREAATGQHRATEDHPGVGELRLSRVDTVTVPPTSLRRSPPD